MRYLILGLLMISQIGFLHSQIPVSHLPMNRNLLLEEFTGHLCPYSPLGALYADSIVSMNAPGRVQIISYHATSFADPNGHKNFKTSFGNFLASVSQLPFIPVANFNRMITSYSSNMGYPPIDYRIWLKGPAEQVLAMPSPVNLAAQCYYYEGSDELHVDVSMYLTDSIKSELYLHIAVLQDSILDYQAGGSTYYPQRVESSSGLYYHMNVFRENLKLDNNNFMGELIPAPVVGMQYDRTYTHKVNVVDTSVLPVMNHLKIVAYLTDTVAFGTVITSAMANALNRPLGVVAVPMPENFQAYPNPFNDLLRLQSDRFDVYRYSLLDAKGGEVENGSFEGTEHLLDLARLNSGLYFINLQDSQNRTSNLRILKN